MVLFATENSPIKKDGPDCSEPFSLPYLGDNLRKFRDSNDCKVRSVQALHEVCFLFFVVNNQMFHGEISLWMSLWEWAAPPLFRI